MHIATTFLLLALSALATGFPDGGPVDTCVKERVNQPYHGTARAQPASRNPYRIVASGESYRPGTQIAVRIKGPNFKGFFIQARDTRTKEWIGSWSKTDNTKSHEECVAITHADPREKQVATFIWNAPLNAQGKVYFTGTVLADYATFWSDMVSQVGSV